MASDAQDHPLLELAAGSELERISGESCRVRLRREATGLRPKRKSTKREKERKRQGVIKYFQNANSSRVGFQETQPQVAFRAFDFSHSCSGGTHRSRTKRNYGLRFVRFGTRLPVAFFLFFEFRFFHSYLFNFLLFRY